MNNNNNNIPEELLATNADELIEIAREEVAATGPDYLEPAMKEKGRRNRKNMFTSEGKKDSRGKLSRHRFEGLRIGSVCPSCAFLSKNKSRPLKLDEDGHALPVHTKLGTLEHCGCGCRTFETNHLFCSGCKWSNF